MPSEDPRTAETAKASHARTVRREAAAVPQRLLSVAEAALVGTYQKRNRRWSGTREIANAVHGRTRETNILRSSGG